MVETLLTTYFVVAAGEPLLTGKLVELVAAGGSVTTALLLYYVFKIDPRMRTMELIILQGQQIDLIKLAKEVSHPELTAKISALKNKVDKQISERE